MSERTVTVAELRLGDIIDIEGQRYEGTDIERVSSARHRVYLKTSRVLLTEEMFPLVYREKAAHEERPVARRGMPSGGLSGSVA